MTISDADLSTIDELLGNPAAGAETGAEVRRRLPHLSLTRCDASDMTETPYRVFPAFELYLISTADHCVQFTGDPASATGIVLARRG